MRAGLSGYTGYVVAALVVSLPRKRSAANRIVFCRGLDGASLVAVLERVADGAGRGPRRNGRAAARAMHVDSAATHKTQEALCRRFELDRCSFCAMSTRALRSGEAAIHTAICLRSAEGEVP